MNHFKNVKIDFVLKHLHLTNPVYLGKGGEGWIFEYSNSEILKIYSNADRKYLTELSDFQKRLQGYKFSFKTPLIKVIGEVNGVYYTIEIKMSGKQLDSLMVRLPNSKRKLVYQHYYDAIKEINDIELSNNQFGQILSISESLKTNTWNEFLLNKLKQILIKNEVRLNKGVENFANKLEFFRHLLKTKCTNDYKRMVHGDYYLNNVLVDDNLRVSAVLDFSVHMVTGDPRQDVMSVLAWNDLNPAISTDDYDFLYAQAMKDYGDDISYYVDLYRVYSAIYYSGPENEDFSVRNLNNNEAWDRLGFNG